MREKTWDGLMEKSCKQAIKHRTEPAIPTRAEELVVGMRRLSKGPGIALGRHLAPKKPFERGGEKHSRREVLTDKSRPGETSRKVFLVVHAAKGMKLHSNVGQGVYFVRGVNATVGPGKYLYTDRCYKLR